MHVAYFVSSCAVRLTLRALHGFCAGSIHRKQLAVSIVVVGSLLLNVGSHLSRIATDSLLLGS